MNHAVDQIAAEYFDYVAECFPVMCASDEFHFLPRAQAAKRYYDRMEDLSPEAMAASVNGLREFRRRFDRIYHNDGDLESRIDVEILRANLAGILIELEEKISWRHNPLLYLKIASIGLDHAWTKPASGQAERLERVRSRLDTVPRLFQQAVENLHRIPEDYHRAARAMVRDCRVYVKESGKRVFARNKADGLEPYLAKVLDALAAFERCLLKLSPITQRELQVVSTLEMTVREHFLSSRNLEEVFEIGVAEWHECFEGLQRLQKQIDPDRTWEELYHGYNPRPLEEMDTFSLYEREARRLTRFFGKSIFDMPTSGRPLRVVPTPAYLRSVRSSASFSAAFSGHVDECDLFYITSAHEGENGNAVRGRLHREFRFLTAHETVPGHHLLDSVRRSLTNPIRRQIESPLFYEGWAYYAESLLGEYGYIERPIENLVDLKRRLWRAARCQVDVGLNTGKLAEEDAIELISASGFSRREAHRQVDRFKLNPGYQLCYSLGRYEIMRLRKQYGSKMGLGEFHRQLLEGGELPFHLAEKRLKRRANT